MINAGGRGLLATAVAVRIELSDSSRLVELCEFFRNAHAVARIECAAVIVHLQKRSGPPNDSALNQVRWSTWCGRARR
jgi:hypothetical protein